MTYREIAEALEELPVAVRSARRSRGLSLRAAAEQIGCSFSTLDRFESKEERETGVQLAPVLLMLRWLDTTPDVRPKNGEKP